MAFLSRCKRSCNTFYDPIYVSIITIFNMITKINESKKLIKHISLFM